MHGEEFGGAPIDSPWVWVLDPIDGTFNYAAGSPMAAILLGLLHDGEPVAGLTWMPFTDDRYTAVADGPLMKNGVAQPSLTHTQAGRRPDRRRYVQRRRPGAVSRDVIGSRCWRS